MDRLQRTRLGPALPRHGAAARTDATRVRHRDEPLALGLTDAGNPEAVVLGDMAGAGVEETRGGGASPRRSATAACSAWLDTMDPVLRIA
jgi:hypothetical protein